MINHVKYFYNIMIKEKREKERKSRREKERVRAHTHTTTPQPLTQYPESIVYQSYLPFPIVKHHRHQHYHNL